MVPSECPLLADSGRSAGSTAGDGANVRFRPIAVIGRAIRPDPRVRLLGSLARMKRSDELAMTFAPLGALLPSALLFGETTRSVMLLGVPLSYVVALLLGWPLLALLRHRGWARLWTLSLSGLALSLPFSVLSGAILGWGPALGVLLSGVLGGGLVWFLAVGPNNSFKPKPLRGSA